MMLWKHCKKMKMNLLKFLKFYAQKNCPKKRKKN